MTNEVDDTLQSNTTQLAALSCVHTAYDTRLKLKICFENPAKRKRPFQLALFAPFKSIFLFCMLFYFDTLMFAF